MILCVARARCLDSQQRVPCEVVAKARPELPPRIVRFQEKPEIRPGPEPSSLPPAPPKNGKTNMFETMLKGFALTLVGVRALIILSDHRATLRMC